MHVLFLDSIVCESFSSTLSHVTTANPPRYPANATYAPNGTYYPSSGFASSTNPSLADWGNCTLADPTSCSCQTLFNSLASTYQYTMTWTDPGGISTEMDDNGQISVVTVPATVETYTDSGLAITDQAYTAPTDCCQPCYLLAYHVQLLFWPIDLAAAVDNHSTITTTASIPYTTVSDGFTLYACTLPPPKVPY